MNLAHGLPSEPGSSRTARAVSLLGPAVAYALYIFVAGSLPDVAPPMGANDKSAHFVAFGLMVPLIARALRFRPEGLSDAARIWTSVGTSSGLGALLEFWQLLLPYRSAEVLDWVADSIGAVLAGLALSAVIALSSRLSKPHGNRGNR